MRLTLLTVGSRGDVQPFIALALELMGRGHAVKLAAPNDLRDLVETFGVPFAPLRAEYLELAGSPEGQAAVRGDPRAAMKLLREVVLPGTRGLLDDARAAAEGADALVFHPKALAGRHLAEWLDIPGWLFVPAPLLVPTRAFALPGTVGGSLGPLNRLTYALAPLAEAPLRGEISQWRETLGLNRRFSSQSRRAGDRILPVLHAYSALLCPAPADWDAGAHITGFWSLPQ
ncbi:glycosyltransferase, partial [Deinococcus sp.]|uniref:glycosyltransferase n=1 Tax=Deinococcus sp. TaxID=47478 RepID=UPI00286992AC